MNYWKLGCRWGSKSAGKPLFFDLLKKENIVISWDSLDFGKNAMVLLADGFTPIGIAKTLSSKRPIKELIDKESDFNEKQIYFDEKLVYYNAVITPISNPNFSYDAQQGIIRISQDSTIKQMQSYMSSLNRKVKVDSAKKIIEYKKQIILQGPPGTGKTKLAKEIAKDLISSNKLESKTVQVKVLTKDYIKSNLKENQKIESKNNKEFEVVALEKNVVLLKSDISKPWKPSYNKIIESFNNMSWEIKGRTGGFIPYEDAIAKYFYENHFESIPSVEENSVNEGDFFKLIQFHPSYSYEDFVRGIVSKPNEEGEGILYQAENKTLAKFASLAYDDPDNNYVLIIDEINRANLSSVLGELIYALEYRGKSVDSIYSVEGNSELILPPNLYIMGTMNTADRSVGHIDYAIRRRFAFVDVLPKNLKTELGDDFDENLFMQVANLFIANFDPSKDYEREIEYNNSEYLNSDFNPKDVWLGHSYFIRQYKKNENDKKSPFDFNLRLDFEIKPILFEYIKDGILKESAKKQIESLKATI